MPDWCEAQEWCPITVTAELLGRKWHPVIVERLLRRPMGFNELKRQVHDISDKVLSDSLKDLQDKGILRREVINKSPEKVRYSLTESGESLEPVVKSMKAWGDEHTGAQL